MKLQKNYMLVYLKFMYTQNETKFSKYKLLQNLLRYRSRYRREQKRRNLIRTHMHLHTLHVPAATGNGNAMCIRFAMPATIRRAVRHHSDVPSVYHGLL